MKKNVQHRNYRSVACFHIHIGCLPSGGKEVPLKKQPQAEVIVDSDRYVIGPEDVLYIHVWNEETLSRTVPVRMDGKISIPLLDEVQAAGLTPLQLKEALTGCCPNFKDNIEQD